MTVPEPEHTDVARRVLTDRQFRAWIGRQLRYSEASIALSLGVSRRTVRDTIAEAQAKIDREVLG